MSNGSEACCAVGVCCPPAARKAALVKILVDNTDPPLSADQASTAAEVILGGFSLAPKTFEPLMEELVGMWKAHGHP